MLSARTGTILKSIVGEYIISAIPVPSQSIANDAELGVSSATVRNEMAQLEHEGYIIRPHSSAGSIPSDKGYRYYVDSLDEVMLSAAEQRLIGHLFHQVERELEKWLSLAATLAARLVHNVAVVTIPKTTDCRLKHVELLVLRDSLVLVVLILHGAKVRQKLTTFDQAVSQAELTVAANKLNAAFPGLTSPQIRAKDIRLSPLEQQIADLLISMMCVEDEQEYEEPYLDGWHFMLEQPEFAHSYRMRGLMELAEHRNLLKTIIPRRLESQKVQVIIGKENEEETFQNYSVVISQYGIPEEAVGTVGVLGPTRMPYAHSISAVGYLSSVLSGLVAGLYGKETPTKAIQNDAD